MSIAITIPHNLQQKLGPAGAEELAALLADTITRLEEEQKNHILEVAENRFERRLTEVKEELRVEISASKTDIIRWIFVVTFGQFLLTIGTISGIMFALFNAYMK